MIIISAYVTCEDKYLCLPNKVIEKYPNDYDFGFDVMDARAWYRWLKARDLPRVTRKGSPIAYRVFIWGVSKGMGFKGGKTLFPGKDAHSKLSVVKFGRLDLNEDFWGV